MFGAICIYLRCLYSIQAESARAVSYANLELISRDLPLPLQERHFFLYGASPFPLYLPFLIKLKDVYITPTLNNKTSLANHPPYECIFNKWLLCMLLFSMH